MKFGTLLQGSSWSFKVGQVLFVQDDCHHHHSPLACDNSRFLLEDIHLQLDWKSLRRLPASDAIVLSVQTIFSPAEDLRGEPHIPQLLAKILREGRWPKACKEPGVVEDALLPALDCWAEEQRAFGVVPAECKEDEYPFFPGWEAAVFDEEEQ